MIANKKAYGLMHIANGPTIDCKQQAGRTRIANSSLKHLISKKKGMGR